MKTPACIGLAILAAGLAGCSSPPPPRMDADLERYSDAGAQAYQRGAPAKAAEFYRQALARAREIDGPDEIARTSFNLALCLAGEGAWDEATARLQEARRDFGDASEHGLQALVLEAGWARARGQTDRARSLAEEALAQPALKRWPDLEAQSRLLLAELQLGRGEAAGAAASLAAAKRAAGRARRAAVMAQVARVQAELDGAEGRPAEAAAAFDEQAGWLQGADDFVAMAQALRRAGDAYAAAGNPQRAVDRYYRAARSAWGRHDADFARAALAGAAAAVAASGDKDWGARVRALQAEVDREGQAGAAHGG